MLCFVSFRKKKEEIPIPLRNAEYSHLYQCDYSVITLKITEINPCHFSGLSLTI